MIRTRHRHLAIDFANTFARRSQKRQRVWLEDGWWHVEEAKFDARRLRRIIRRIATRPDADRSIATYNLGGVLRVVADDETIAEMTEFLAVFGIETQERP